jgi:hypothetical protein
MYQIFVRAVFWISEMTLFLLSIHHQLFLNQTNKFLHMFHNGWIQKHMDILVRMTVLQ